MLADIRDRSDDSAASLPAEGPPKRRRETCCSDESMPEREISALNPRCRPVASHSGGAPSPGGGLSLVARAARALEAHFIWLLLLAYGVATVLPRPGLFLRNLSVGRASLIGKDAGGLSLPMLLLAFLLWNAGLGVERAQLRNLIRSPRALLAGVAANLIVPCGFVLVLALLASVGGEGDRGRSVIVGLALVASMPIAGSSTAWALKANGDLALSLGLVVLSTLLSPATTPLVLHAIGLATGEPEAAELAGLAAWRTGAFLTLCVTLPSVLGILTRLWIGDRGSRAARPALKLANGVDLLLLNYSAAAVSLPQLLRSPDPGVVALSAGAATALCLASFGSGHLVSRALRARREQEASLLFGLGMNNNGTGLVIASLALGHRPLVMLPIIFYNLLQHLVAGAVDRWRAARGGAVPAVRAEGRPGPPPRPRPSLA